MKRKHNRLESNRLGYLMTIPASILILVVSIYPLFQGILLGFQNYNLQKPKKRAFNGFDNYIKLFTEDTEFHSAILYTFIYTFATVAIAYLLGLFLAMLLNRHIKGRGVFRTLALLPWIVAPSVASTNWIWLMNDQVGWINKFLKSIGLIDNSILFLADEKFARVTVIFTDMWRDYPFMIIVILAGLQSIPKDLYESAYIDGAGFWKSFRYITMPMIKGVSAISTILMFIWVFNHFDNIYLITNGGPNNATFTLPILTYYTAFYRSNIGYASSMASMMLIVLLVVALIYLRVMKTNNEE